MPYGVKVRVLSAAHNSKIMQENQTEKKSVLQVVIHSFFVVPFIIAIFAVIIFLVIRLMTTEPNSARDYLEDVKIGGTTKRWQGAFELSKLLSNPKMIPKDEMFVNEMISTFEYSSNDRDKRIRQYLAIAMGATKDERYSSTLINAIESADIGVVQACAFALGNIGDAKAIEPLKKDTQRFRSPSSPTWSDSPWQDRGTVFN